MVDLAIRGALARFSGTVLLIIDASTVRGNLTSTRASVKGKENRDQRRRRGQHEEG